MLLLLVYISSVFQKSVLYVRLGRFAAFVSQAEGGKTAPRIVYLNGFNRLFSKHVYLNVNIPLKKYRKRHETKVNDNHILVTFQLTLLLYWCVCINRVVSF